MSELEAHDPKVLAQYEGLIFSTARRYAAFVDLDLEDVQQILRVKVFKALLSYEPAKATVRVDGRDPRDTYVFQCVKNQAKDLLKKKPRNESFLEDVAPANTTYDATTHAPSRDRFENDNGLASTHEEVYGAIEDDDLVIPNTLTPLEHRIICLLYASYRQSEVARSLGLAKRDMERSMRSIRAKMEDWRPTGVVVVFVTDRAADPVAIGDHLAAA